MYGHESCCDCTEDSRPGSFRLGDHCEAHYEQAGLADWMRENLHCERKPRVIRSPWVERALANALPAKALSLDTPL